MSWVQRVVKQKQHTEGSVCQFHNNVGARFFHIVICGAFTNTLLMVKSFTLHLTRELPRKNLKNMEDKSNLIASIRVKYYI